MQLFAGRRVKVNTLVEVATPEHHARFHDPDPAGVLADHVMVWIKADIDKDPTAPEGVIFGKNFFEPKSF